MVAAGVGCASADARKIGEFCLEEGQCESGLCYESECLDPDEDRDSDGLLNGIEKNVTGTDYGAADTDRDGVRDDVEVGAQLQSPTDTDGDGLIDALESMLRSADGDRDCLPDQYDAENSVYNDDMAAVVRANCASKGVCAERQSEVTAYCQDGAPTCDYAAVAGYEAAETLCDGVDNDCDGDTDEGLDGPECPWNRCVPECDDGFHCDGGQCVEDACVPECDDGFHCDGGQCVEDACVPDCTGLICGPDPICGTSCGECGDGFHCDGGQCVEDACIPDCTGLICGPDPICGTSCGECGDGFHCDGGQCAEDACVPDCAGLICGPDPVCGASCGECGDGFHCDGGQCAEDACVPDCSGVSCGPDPVCGTLDCGQCVDFNDCTDDFCVAGECVFEKLSGTQCSDGSMCTEGETCVDGECLGDATNCDDDNVCTQDSCEPVTGCSNVPTAGICDDGNICTTNDVCSDQTGECAGTEPFGACDDQNDCTTDSCDPADGCVHTSTLAVCDDGNPCTFNDVCRPDGFCEGPLGCDDGLLCTIDTCETGIGCVFSPKCPEGSAYCTIDSCDPETGFCESVPKCDDFNLCTEDRCDMATYVCSHPTIDCDDGNPCTDDWCDPAVGCVIANNSNTCDDFDLCTLDDICVNGTCAGSPVICDDGVDCTLETCDGLGGCFSEPMDPACGDDNPCTDDFCDPVGGCVYMFNSNPCNDGDPLTLRDTCVEGMCVCVPDCAGLACGDDGCGGSCGECGAGHECQYGACAATMVLIPAGAFMMGCNSVADSGCESDELPYHQVTLSAFYIDKTEVTQTEYKKCVDAGACTTPACSWDPVTAASHPVRCLAWASASGYCTWVGKRLPTEAEWEKAARGVDGRKYPWGNIEPTCDYAVTTEGGDGCGTGDTFDVCSRSPAGDSPYDLCDMAGNVEEWVEDWYDAGYYGVSPTSNPPGPGNTGYKSSRGGSFYSQDGNVRIADRYGYDPGYANFVFIGFRCAMGAE